MRYVNENILPSNLWLKYVRSVDKREIIHILPTFHPTLRNITNYVLLARAEMVAQVVAHQTTDREVPDSIPPGSWAFFLLSILSEVCP